MRTQSIALIGLLILSVHAAPAAAQRRRAAPVPSRAPSAGMVAVGASIGADIPSDPNLKKGLDVAGTVEGYVTPRVSVRGQVGAAWWDVEGRGFGGTVKPLYFDANVVYNWEGGAVHPYVTAGVGAYKFRSTVGGAEGSDTKAGFNVGGGAEFFFSPRATFTAEALFHRVDSFATPRGTFGDGSFWRIAMGMKAYF